MLPEEATEAGLLGAASFFRTRDLSRPFSGGEWAGLTRGVAGSYRVKRDRQRARLSKQTGGKPLACTCRSNKLGPHVQTQINIPVRARTLPHTHTHTFHSPVTPFSLCVLCLTFCMNGKRNTASKHARTHTQTLHTHNQYYDRLVAVKGVQASTGKWQKKAVLGSHWGMWLSSSFETQSYLIGNIHHQVVTFVTVTVLKSTIDMFGLLGGQKQWYIYSFLDHLIRMKRHTRFKDYETSFYLKIEQTVWFVYYLRYCI